VLVDIGYVLGKAEVIFRVTLVSYEPEEVEPGEQCCWELDVGFGRLLDIVATKGGICSCQDKHSGI